MVLPASRRAERVNDEAVKVLQGNTLKNWRLKKAENDAFKTVEWFFFKKCCLLHVLSRWVNSRGLHPLQPAVQPPASRRAKRVNGEEVRDFNLLFFVYFICKWRGNFEKVHFFTLRAKQFFYLTHSAREYFEKLAFRKRKKCKFKRLYLKSCGVFRVKTNNLGEFIQLFSQNGCFLQALPMWVHSRRTHPLKPPVLVPAARRTQGNNDEPGKDFNLLFFMYLIWKWGETF